MKQTPDKCRRPCNAPFDAEAAIEQIGHPKRDARKKAEPAASKMGFFGAKAAFSVH